MDLSNMSYLGSVLECGPKSGFYGNEFLTTELICVTILLTCVYQAAVSFSFTKLCWSKIFCVVNRQTFTMNI